MFNLLDPLKSIKQIHTIYVVEHEDDTCMFLWNEIRTFCTDMYFRHSLKCTTSQACSSSSDEDGLSMNFFQPSRRKQGVPMSEV